MKSEIEVPDGWEIAKINEICKINPPYRLSKGTEYDYLPMAGVLEHYRGITGYDKRVCGKYGGSKFKMNDIVFAKITPCTENGKVALVKNLDTEFGIGSTEFIVFSADCSKIIPPYLYRLLTSYKIHSKAVSLMEGTTGRKRVPKEIFNSISVILPSINEQQKIADILSKIDEQIQQTEKIIDKTEELKKGLMQKLLTKGIGHTRFKQTELGEIPDVWEIVKLKDVCLDFLGGGTPSTSNSAYWGGKIPWMTSAYIDGRYVNSGQKYITKEGLEKSATNLVPKDNILFVTRVGIGKLTVNLIDIAISQDITGIILNKNRVNVGFMYWSLLKVAAKMKSFAQGTTIKGILKSDLARQKLSIPRLKEQEKISKILMKVENQIETNISQLSELRQLKKALMQDLLTGRVRVTV